MLIYVLFGSIVVIALSFLLFSYTPLNRLIPNVTPDSEQAIINKDKKNISKIEKMGEDADAQHRYNQNLISILRGDSVTTSDQVEAPTDTTNDYTNIEFGTSVEDSILRARIAEEERFSVSGVSDRPEERDDKMSGVFFFTPLEGDVTNSFGGERGHNGVDIIAPENEAVKSTLDGTVIFSGWTTDNGHIIQVQHAHNLVSIYKHNSVLLKTEGDKVRAGEPIAIVGNTGDLSTGAHLHFELWYNGNPINPQEFITF